MLTALEPVSLRTLQDLKHYLTRSWNPCPKKNLKPFMETRFMPKSSPHNLKSPQPCRACHLASARRQSEHTSLGFQRSVNLRVLHDELERKSLGSRDQALALLRLVWTYRLVKKLFVMAYTPSRATDLSRLRMLLFPESS